MRDLRINDAVILGTMLLGVACSGRALDTTCGPATALSGQQCIAVQDSGAAVDGATGGGPADSSLSDGAGSVNGDGSKDAGAVADGSPGTCPSGRGPDMVRVPAPSGSDFCIDSTEVTMAQYQQFLNAKGMDTSGQPAECSSNATFTPDTTACGSPDGGANPYDPSMRADYPVSCVDWCDAYAFCAWAGKSLCGSYTGTALTQFPESSEWYWACTDGPDNAGPVYTSCNVGLGLSGTIEPVRSSPQCVGSGSPWSQIYDLVGNVYEFVDLPGVSVGDSAIEGKPPSNGPGAGCGATQPVGSVTANLPNVGFRCCAAP